MPRYKLTIEYDGTPYAGWQRQADQPSVQGAIEQAVYRFAQEDVTLHTAGRTDAGVHARGQVAHFDLHKNRSEYEVCEGLNFYLQQEPIAILSAQTVSQEFHARFGATFRRYHYRIINRRAALTLEANRAWQHAAQLDAPAMHHAAQHLLGQHDFSTFRASECQSNSPVKTLDRLDVARVGNEVHIDIQARSFLHHQVRNFVGTLSLIGTGKWDEQDLLTALAACDRKAGGLTAPACGLYFMEVGY